MIRQPGWCHRRIEGAKRAMPGPMTGPRRDLGFEMRISLPSGFMKEG